MRVVKCTSNHFFDADKYTTCPQCGAAQQSESGAGNSNVSVSKPTNPAVGQSKLSKAGETFGVFKNKVNKKSPFKTPETNNYEKLKQFQPEPVSQKPIWERQTQNEDIVFDKVDNSVLENTPEQTAQAAILTPSPVEPPMNQPVVAAPVVPAPIPTPVPATVPEHTEVPEENTLLEEIKKVASDNDGKTVGFFSSGKSSSDDSDDKGSSEQVPANIPSEEPVVGWLICIEGPNIGQCFNIYAGKNSLGRSNTNRIVVNKDRSISRDKHSWIIYEPKKRDFFAQPGDSSGLTYVNDEVIMQPTKLEKKTIIEVGSTKLMLIPLCGEDFSWEDYLK